MSKMSNVSTWNSGMATRQPNRPTPPSEARHRAASHDWVPEPLCVP